MTSSLFKKVFMALKGSASEIGEAIVDSNGIKILEQEIRELKEALVKAKDSELSLRASYRQYTEKHKLEVIKTLGLESEVKTALKLNREDLALEIAACISDSEKLSESYITQARHFEKSAEQIIIRIKQSESKIHELEREIQHVKATESMHKVHESIHSNVISGNSKIASAKDSLARIRERQDHNQAKIDIENEREEKDDLDERLKTAGIRSGQKSALDIINRIKSESK